MTVLQLQATVGRREASVTTQVVERGHESLIDIERRELMQFFEKVRALGHYLRQQWNGLRRPLTNESAKLRPTQKHRFGFFRSVGVGDIRAVRRQSFTAECLSRSGDDRYEAAAHLDLVTKDDVPFEHDEDSVGRRATLI